MNLNATKSLALAYDKPFIGINHLNAHISANFIDTDLKPPFIALLVSGGHTQIIDVKSYSELKIIGETIDDAVGEAYDKVARLIGLPYPGGPKLDKLAQEGNPFAFKLPEAKVDGYNFSFSGLKTAVLRLLATTLGAIKKPCNIDLWIPNVGPTSFPSPGNVSRSAANFIKSFLPTIYAPLGAIPPPKFLIKDPTAISAPTSIGSFSLTNSQ